MPKFLMKRWHGYHVAFLFVVAFIFIAILTFYTWKIGVLGLFSLGALLIHTAQAKRAFENELEQYIATLSHRVNKAGEEAVTKLPIGMLLYNEDFMIEWTNPYLVEILKEPITGKSLEDVSEKLIPLLEKGENRELLEIGEQFFQVIFKRDDRLLYFFDETEKVKTKEMYSEEQTVIGLIYLDNYDEVTQSMDDEIRSKLISQVTSSLNHWAEENDILLRRMSSDKFLAVFNQKSLQFAEESKFVILDEIRAVTTREKVPLTLSIGIGTGEASLRELGALAQSSLDLALGRGGDQVAIKERSGKVRFYGGKSNAIEKRTRVRARVISHALRDIVLESDSVLIMGHKYPDMDAIGASIGVLKIAEANNRKGFIVLNRDEIHSDVGKLMEEIEGHPFLWSQFITPEEAFEKVTRRTLLIVVDTHRPSLLIEPRLLEKAERVVVLDHHRRGEEFIKDPVLVYMEPYASSTAELVTELLEYQPQQLKMDTLEATALLAGIIVDTNSFSIRTGSRTFDAASYLRRNGADTTLVQQLMKEDFDQYIKRSKLVESAQIYEGGVAIAKGDSDEVYSQVLIAQAADTLLAMNGVTASFVISKREDGRVSISARSLGEMNVQLIMEALNGGGHLTNAATQLEDVTVDDAEMILIQAIEQQQGGNEK